MFIENARKAAHFLAVAKAGSLSAAAREIGISQPALTTSIRKFEKSLGFDLFDRNNGFQLTAQGREFQIRAAAALSRLNDLGREAASIRTGELGEIRAGCGPTVADGIIGEALGRLLSSHPRLNIQLIVGSFHELEDMLRGRRIDFFVADYTSLLRTGDLEITPLPLQEIIFYCRPGHPLANLEAVSVKEFFSYPHIGTILPRWAEEWLRKNRPEGASSGFLSLECSHHTLLKNVILSSDAISGAPAEVVQKEIESGRFSRIFLDLEPMQNRAGVVWLADRELNKASKMLIDVLCNYEG